MISDKWNVEKKKSLKADINSEVLERKDTKAAGRSPA